MLYIAVVPCAGAWIEIGLQSAATFGDLVVPCAGAWIEIISSGGKYTGLRSHPTWVRGLKCLTGSFCYREKVAPCGAHGLRSREKNGVVTLMN